jgi:hypothetical protein
MPLYDVKCSRSGKIFERQIPLAQFEEPIICSCQSPATRVISKPRIIVDNVGYHCPVTDKWIGSKREHRENLKQQGCRVLETGEKEANERQRLKMETEFDRGIEETVEKTIDSWDSDKREMLAKELQAGVDLQYARGIS